MVAVEGSVPRVYLGSVFCFVPANRRVKNSGFARHGSAFGLTLNARWQIELEAFNESDGDLELVTEVSDACPQGDGSLGKSSRTKTCLPWCNRIFLAASRRGFFGLMTLLMETSTVPVMLTGQCDLQGQDLL